MKQDIPPSQAPFRIWIDADACPRPIKEMLYRASARKSVPLILVANIQLTVPDSELISVIRVPPGVDGADNEIVKLVEPGDLVVTADIPLAADVVKKGAVCLDPRGTLHTLDTMHEKLSMRNLFEELRGTEEVFGGPAAFSQKDRQAFANQLDKFLSEKFRPAP